MATQSVDVLVAGGKATAAPPLGPALGPLGVNIGQVVAEINKKTASFKGMQVPVKVKVDTDTKAFEISIGTPPASQLILKEAGVESGASNALKEKVADLKIEQVIKIAKMKEDALLGKDLKQRVKEIIGTCRSMGILIEGVPAGDAVKLVNEGKFDKEIKAEKTELTDEELKKLEAEKKHLAEELEKRRSEYEARAKSIMKEMEGKTRAQMKAKMVDAGIPDAISNKILPAEEKAAPGGKGKK